MIANKHLCQKLRGSVSPMCKQSGDGEGCRRVVGIQGDGGDVESDDASARRRKTPLPTPESVEVAINARDYWRAANVPANWSASRADSTPHGSRGTKRIGELSVSSVIEVGEPTISANRFASHADSSPQRSRGTKRIGELSGSLVLEAGEPTHWDMDSVLDGTNCLISDSGCDWPPLGSNPGVKPTKRRLTLAPENQGVRDQSGYRPTTTGGKQRARLELAEDIRQHIFTASVTKS